MKYVIIGAGMAGLLAAGILRDEFGSILEAQSELPNNHSALLRFRSSIVGDALNIPFKEVSVMKAVDPWRNPIADMISYSVKTNGTASLRSVISANGLLEKRYIAPPNLIELMARKLPNGKIAFDYSVTRDTIEAIQSSGDKIISTIPMPALMRILDFPFGIDDFGSISGVNVNAEIPDCDVYATLYFPNPKYGFSRASLTGSKLTLEYSFPKESLLLNDHFVRCAIWNALEAFGLPEGFIDGSMKITPQRYAKIRPANERLRQDFIVHATEKFGIYSLGRFATWRPGLLLDDVVKDIAVIQKIERAGSYQYKK